MIIAYWGLYWGPFICEITTCNNGFMGKGGASLEVSGRSGSTVLVFQRTQDLKACPLGGPPPCNSGILRISKNIRGPSYNPYYPLLSLLLGGVHLICLYKSATIQGQAIRELPLASMELTPVGDSSFPFFPSSLHPNLLSMLSGK